MRIHISVKYNTVHPKLTYLLYFIRLRCLCSPSRKLHRWWLFQRFLPWFPIRGINSPHFPDFSIALYTIFPGLLRSLRFNLAVLDSVGAQLSLAYNRTGRMYVLYIFPRVVRDKPRDVIKGCSCLNLPHAALILAVTLASQPPPESITSPR